ncbi:hypothetical protein [Fastidiosipila sanguinis]|uniref:Uncharacterized protein n=1 Tax=Fastidiosipila sanguinis TaxID=236753 RepID=A0A2S0KP07_9FIRM|nr:hypothetical protein [Fastidiosipila sanguinis]AVM42771.1 hypothetical protein C5Q98_05895 [Fastidiosipila sanguinis]
MKRKAKEFGIEAVLHGNRGKQAHNAISIADKNFIVNLALNEFKAYNFSHFRDVLEEDYNINISRSSLHSILKQEGIVSPKRKKRRPKYHRSRKRRGSKGELVQIDASQFDWFGTGEKVYLHGIIDDSSSEILALYFAKEETLKG